MFRIDSQYDHNIKKNNLDPDIHLDPPAHLFMVWTSLLSLYEVLDCLLLVSCTLQFVI